MEIVHSWSNIEQGFGYYSVVASNDGGITLTASSSGSVRVSSSIHLGAESARAIAANLIAAADSLEDAK